MRIVGHRMLVGALAIIAVQEAVHAAGYVVTPLVTTSNALPAVQHDPNLVNGWGLAESATSPFWVSDNGTGLATLYNTSGAPQALVVMLPPPGGSPAGTASTPTGIVFNGTSDFKLSNNAAALFIFATEDGTIAAWNSGSGTTGQLPVDNSAAGAVYKGIALANNGSSNVLYAANFRNARIDIFGPTFQPITAPGAFTPPAGLPAGFAPFNVQTLGSSVYVTYAMQDAQKHDEVDGAGLGWVVRYNQDGTNGTVVASGGTLNAPWGLAIAPSNFGQFSNDLLVGNFGDGSINAFNPATNAFVGQLTNANGVPISIGGLWGLSFGNGGNGGLTNVLYYAAGPGDESQGAFGSIAVAPEPASIALLGIAAGGLLLRRKR